jgi:hypothetical protein
VLFSGTACVSMHEVLSSVSSTIKIKTMITKEMPLVQMAMSWVAMVSRAVSVNSEVEFWISHSQDDLSRESVAPSLGCSMPIHQARDRMQFSNRK